MTDRYGGRSPRRGRARRRAASALAVLVLGACTTVHRSAVATGPGGTQPAGGRAASSVAGTTVGGAAPGAVGSTVPSAVGPGAVAAAGGSFGSASDPTGPAVGAAAGATTCATPVKLGVSYSSDLATGLAVVGNPSAATQTGDIAATIEARTKKMAAYVNSLGGLAGCPIELVYHDFKALGADGFSGQSQTECADFAEDQHVFAVLTGLGGALENETLISCLAQHGVVTIWGAGTGTYTPSSADFARYRGYLYQPGGMAPDRWGSYIDQLGGAGFLPSGAKVGILLADDGTGNNQRLVDGLWKPALQARGINPTVFTFSEIRGYSQVSSTASQFSSAVLAFKAAGIDHVIMTSDNANASVFFTQVASSQGYHPRYALNTNNSPATWSTEPGDQTADALAVSFTATDIGIADPSELAKNPPNPARDKCIELFTGDYPPNEIASAFPICDQLMVLQAALAGATEVTPASLLAGTSALGGSLPLAGGYLNASFGPDRSDGSSATRVMRFDLPTSSWVYVGDPVPVP